MGVYYTRNKLYKSKARGSIDLGKVYNMAKKWKLDYNEIKNKAIEKNLELLTDEKEYAKKLTKTTLFVKNEHGYIYPMKTNTLLYDRGAKSTRFSIFSKKNPYLEHNIKLFIKNEKDDMFILKDGQIDDSFDRNMELIFVCKRCRSEIKISLFNALRGVVYKSGKCDHHRGLICPFCDGKIESMHANILKQVFMHEYPDTVLEDKSCINPITNAILPTDIVNHRLKIAVEVQSSFFHNKEYQKIKDKIKYNYWVDNGYKFYNYFIEDYSLIEYIQLFFPNIKKIPDYINPYFNNSLNIVKAQSLLNDGNTVVEVSNIMNINVHRIYDAIYAGKLYYPEGYQKYKMTPVVMLDVNKNFLRTYNTYREAENDNNISYGNIASCIYYKKYYANGFYWIPLSDYESGNYKIPTNRFLKFNVPISVYTNDNEYIRSYNTITEAAKDLRLTSYKIWRVAEGNRNTYSGYKFKYI